MELFGILLPILIDFINRMFTANSDVRLWLSVAVCAIFGIFFNWLQTDFAFASNMAAFQSITASIMATFGLAQLSFKAIWEKTDIHKDLKA